MSGVVLPVTLPCSSEISMKEGLTPLLGSSSNIPKLKGFTNSFKKLTKASSRFWISFPQRQYAEAFCPGK